MPFFALLVALACAAFSQVSSIQPAPEEYRVYAAAIDKFRSTGLASHPVVADHTSTFQCGQGCNGVAIGGCNGLRGKDETASERLAIVQHDLAELEPETISDFKLKNEQCSEIARKIPTKLPYFLFSVDHGDELPAGWEQEDLFYFSRVAFNPQQTQALVHIIFMSGTNAADSAGRYFLFLKKDDKWVPKGSSVVWKLVSR